MTVTLTGAGGLLTILGKAILTHDSIQTYHLTTAKALIEAIFSEMSDKGTGVGVDLSASLASSADAYYQESGLPSALRSYASDLIINRVTADQPTVQANLTACLTELKRQMVAAGSTIERNVVGSTPTPPDANCPSLITSTVDGTGAPLEGLIPETMVCNFASTTTLSVVGGLPCDTMSPQWPDGSGANTSLTVESTGLLANQSFDLETQRPDSPDEWIIFVGTPGTTVSVTNSEVQTITRSGSPTSGYFTISHTRSDGYVQTTDPLPYNADASAVEAALREFVGFVDVAVTWDSGTTKWTIEFNAVTPAGDQALLTTTNTFDTGSLAVAEVTAGGAAMEYKAMAILGNATVETTTVRQRIHGLGLVANGVYAFSCQMQKVGSTTGNIYIEIVDGANTVINNDAGTANQITVDMSTLSNSAFTAKTGFFQLPKNLPAVFYLQFRLAADIGAGTGVYIDDAILTAAQQLYTGGPYAALLANKRDLQSGDRYTIANTNGLAGKYQTWFWRWFGSLLPSASSPSIADP